MMVRVAFGLLLAASAALAQKITMEFDQAIDFSKFRTFAIRAEQLNSKNPSLNNDLVRKRITAQIVKNLESKGMEQTDVRPDLNVRYHLGSGSRREVETYPAGWWGTRAIAVRYAEGTLIIDLRDPTTKSLVWRAIAVQEDRDPLKIQKKLDDMVKKSFDKYPPKK